MTLAAGVLKQLLAAVEGERFCEAKTVIAANGDSVLDTVFKNGVAGALCRTQMAFGTLGRVPTVDLAEGTGMCESPQQEWWSGL